MSEQVYLTDARGVRVLGPYLPGEIRAISRGKHLLGWPEAEVWRVKARSTEEARAKVAKSLAQLAAARRRTDGGA